MCMFWGSLKDLHGVEVCMLSNKFASPFVNFCLGSRGVVHPLLILPFGLISKWVPGEIWGGTMVIWIPHLPSFQG